MIVFDLNLLYLVAIATFVAVLVRKKDTPAEKIFSEDWVTSILTTAVYALVAEGVALFVLDSQGIIASGLAGLMILSAAGMGGMAFVRTALNIATKQ